MRVRALDSNHDWTFGKGANNYLVNINAVAQDINTRLNSFLGDCFFDLSAGLDWWNQLGAKDQTALNLSISAVILNTDGVTGLIQLSSKLDAARRFTVSYQVNTRYSVLSGSVPLSTTTG